MRRRALSILVVFCMCLALLNNVYAEDCAILELVDGQGLALRKFRLSPNAGFAIRYTHSVALSPVTDCFVIRNGEIFLDRTIYQDFGAGLPHEAESGQKMRFENGSITIEGFNRALPELTVRVGRIANHMLLLNQGESTETVIRLDDISPPGSAITFRPRRCPKRQANP